jgi:ankyrin repeat protein
MQVAELLLAHGADPAVRDPQGMTAADRAERNAMFKVAAMLRQRESLIADPSSSARSR